MKQVRILLGSTQLFPAK